MAEPDRNGISARLWMPAIKIDGRREQVARVDGSQSLLPCYRDSAARHGLKAFVSIAMRS